MEAFQRFIADTLAAAASEAPSEPTIGDQTQNLMFPPGFPWNPFAMQFAAQPGVDGFSACPPALDFENLPKFQDLDWNSFCPPPFLSSVPIEAEDQSKPAGKSARVRNKSEVAVATVGTLSQSERKQKILKYLEKRSRRNYAKKISYHCRKRVADQRIRVKGRFVSSKEAELLRGLENEKNNVPWAWSTFI